MIAEQLTFHCSNNNAPVCSGVRNPGRWSVG